MYCYQKNSCLFLKHIFRVYFCLISFCAYFIFSMFQWIFTNWFFHTHEPFKVLILFYTLPFKSMSPAVCFIYNDCIFWISEQHFPNLLIAVCHHLVNLFINWMDQERFDIFTKAILELIKSCLFHFIEIFKAFPVNLFLYAYLSLCLHAYSLKFYLVLSYLC